jgi:hypothetical protein
MTLPARRSGAPRAVPPGAAGYFWRCFTCGCLLALSPEQAVIIEAEQCAGIDHVVFCGRCIQRAAARMVDGG